MRHRTLGRSGAVVSTQALGTMTFGSEADETTSGEILGAFVERGGTLVDTADVYSSGVSEEIVGRWLAKHPTDAARRAWRLHALDHRLAKTGAGHLSRALHQPGEVVRHDLV